MSTSSKNHENEGIWVCQKVNCLVYQSDVDIDSLRSFWAFPFLKQSPKRDLQTTLDRQKRTRFAYPWLYQDQLPTQHATAECPDASRPSVALNTTPPPSPNWSPLEPII